MANKDKKKNSGMKDVAKGIAKGVGLYPPGWAMPMDQASRDKIEKDYEESAKNLIGRNKRLPF